MTCCILKGKVPLENTGKLNAQEQKLDGDACRKYRAKMTGESPILFIFFIFK